MHKGRLFLAPISAAAFVATWGGWVGLGRMTGFGNQNLLPGFVEDGDWSTVNLVITLPLMIESYAAYAMSVWFSRTSSNRARWFAGASSVLSLFLAATGQISFHVLESKHISAAPVWLTGLVAVLPVLVLGMAAALALLSGDAPETSRETTLGRLWGAAAKAAERRIERLAETPAPSQQAVSRQAQPTVPETPPVSTAPPQPIPETPVSETFPAVSAGRSAEVAGWSSLPRDERAAIVGRMRLETPPPSYARIAERLNISKAEANRLGRAVETRLVPDPFVIVPDLSEATPVSA